jgi:hypothetical protein
MNDRVARRALCNSTLRKSTLIITEAQRAAEHWKAKRQESRSQNGMSKKIRERAHQHTTGKNPMPFFNLLQ